MDALTGLETGQLVRIVVRRNGQIIELEVQL